MAQTRRCLDIGAVLVFLLVSLPVMTMAQDLISCGGFVRTSASVNKNAKTKFDFSVVRVQLVSSTGIVKYEAAPAPNGYYIVPIYDKVGDYKLQLQGPEGWSFAPSSVSLNLKDGQCNGGNDIDFELTGFRVSGAVKSSSSCSMGAVGHPDSKVDLMTSDASSILASTTTDSNGVYHFENVSPGSYSIRSAGSTINAKVSGANLPVSDLTASGYSISGNIIESSNNQPAISIEFVLYSTSRSEVLCNKTALIGFPSTAEVGAPLCLAHSDSNGRFQFDNIPCGTYTLIPFSTGGPALSKPLFEITPSRLPIKIDASSRHISDPFTLKSFRVTGRVINARSKGLLDATIYIDGIDGTVASWITKTDVEGKFRIDQVKSGKYRVKIVKKFYIFEETEVELTPHQNIIPDIKLKQVEICGKVSIPHPPAGVSNGANRKVSMKSVDTSLKFDLTTTTDAHGAFCFVVDVSPTPHHVSIQPFITAAEKQAGLVISSTEDTFVIDTNPIFNANFAQALLAIRGHVNCLSKPCDTSVSVQLTPLSGGETITTGLALSSVNDEHGAGFEFPMLVPGKYMIAMDMGQWCWEKEQFEVTLIDRDISHVTFFQTGYNLRVHSSHALQLESRWINTGNGADEPIRVLEVEAGEANNFCMKKPGTYALTPISCFQFEKETYFFSTEKAENSKPLVLAMKKLKVEGQISIPEGLADSQTTAVAIITRNGVQLEPQALTLTPKGSGLLTYQLWAELKDSVVIKPTSKKLLFYPATSQATILEETCSTGVPLIQARDGLFITGKVIPAVQDIRITVFDETNDKDGVLILDDIKTGADGSYRAGPLYDDRTYRVEADSTGFHLKKEVSDDGKVVNFRAMKLGGLKIRVVDGDKPVSGALLSMSAGGYRANIASDENGEATFTNVFPGDYYLMPLLKEYTFAKDKKPTVVQQHQQPITVTVVEGNDQVITLHATRVAFSCFGYVKSLNGQPEQGVTVEAASGQLLEQAQTDSQGAFRIRGLIPGQEYTLRIASQISSHIERTSPGSYTFTVGKEDIEGKDLLAFRKTASRFELLGRVVTNATLLEHITVQLWEEADPNDKSVAPSDTPVRELKLMKGADFFTFAGLSKTRYSIKLTVDSSINRDIYRFNLDSATTQVTFSRDTPVQEVSVPLIIQDSESVQDIPTSQFYATLLAIAMAFAFYHRIFLIKFIKSKLLKSGSVGKATSGTKKVKKTNEDSHLAHINKSFGKK